MTRGWVSRLVYAPKLPGDCVSEVSSDDEPTLWALKRVRFGTLNTSQRNCKLWFSLGNLTRFPRLMSQLAKPSPRRTFREPTPPGRGRVKSACAATGSAKTLTLPFRLKTPVFGLAVIWVIAVRNQSVGQRWPPSTLKGNPLVQRATPEVCQPPMKASNRPLALPASARPLPTGSSAIQLRLNWWVTSKSETARARFGEKAFARRLP